MSLRLVTIALFPFAVAVCAFALGLLLPSGPARAQSPSMPDLVITKSDSSDPVTSGDSLTYTIVVTNNGDLTAGSPGTPVTIIDPLPSAFTETSFSMSPVGACSLDPPHFVRCEVDTLAPGDSVTITIDGFVTLPYGGSVLNSALVDLPVSLIPVTIETYNNIAQATTTISAISTPSPTPTPTPTATASPTDTPTLTPTQTSTPTRTPKPVGGVSLDAADDPPASSSLSGPTIALLLCLAAGIPAAAGLRYVKSET